jgi:hypothetical protein
LYAWNGKPKELLPDGKRKKEEADVNERNNK